MTIITQADLSSECWMIQMKGLDACVSCEYLNKRDCGGKKIRKKMVNEKGVQVTTKGLISNREA